MQLIIDKLNSVRAEIHQAHVKRMMASHSRFPSSVSIVGLEDHPLLNTRTSNTTTSKSYHIEVNCTQVIGTDRLAGIKWETECESDEIEDQRSSRIARHEPTPFIADHRHRH